MGVIKKDLGEDYPSNWNAEEFKNLKSFNKRVEYSNNNLQRISSGSSRIVYKIDDTKVLKLAKNKKGLAQNELEIEFSRYGDLSDIVAQVFDYAEDNTWLEMELAYKMSPGIFKKITGFNWDEYINAMTKHYYVVNPQHARFFTHNDEVNKEVEEKMWEDEFIYQMLSLMGNYGVPVGDLTKTSSYGVVKRNGADAIVLIDYGINQDIYKAHYKRFN